MDRRLPSPTFANPPTEYSQRYLQDLVRALNDLVTQLRNPGEGRNSTLTLTALPDSPTGLEDGALWDDDGVVRRAGSAPATLLSRSLYGQLSRMSAGTVTITTAGTYVTTGLTGTVDTSITTGLVIGTTDALGLKNDSDETHRVPVYASYDGKAGNNKVLGLKLAVNGVVVDETECRAASGSTREEAKLVTRWILELDDGDEVSLFVANHTDTTNISIERCRLVIG